jgi:hypothetical protein
MNMIPNGKSRIRNISIRTMLIVFCALWEQMVSGQTIITGDDINNVVVTGTSWQVLLKNPFSGGSQYQLADQVVSGIGDDTKYGTVAYSLDVPIQFSITEDGGAIQVYVDGQSTLEDTFRPTTSGNLLQIIISAAGIPQGSGWSTDGWAVNGQSFDGSWSALGGVWSEPTYAAFYISNYGSEFQSLSFTATLNSDDVGISPPADQALIYINEVSGSATVPEPETVGMVAFGLSTFFVKRKPFHFRTQKVDV